MAMTTLVTSYTPSEQNGISSEFFGERGGKEDAKELTSVISLTVSLLAPPQARGSNPPVTYGPAMIPTTVSHHQKKRRRRKKPREDASGRGETNKDRRELIWRGREKEDEQVAITASPMKAFSLMKRENIPNCDEPREGRDERRETR